LQNANIGPHLPAWVLHLPVRKLWLANNQLTSLLPARGGRVSLSSSEPANQLGRQPTGQTARQH